MARAALLFASWGGSRSYSHAAAYEAARASDACVPLAAGNALAALPRDVWESVVQCLVGWDLLQLALVSRVFHTELLADASLWAAHLPQPAWQHDTNATLSCADAKRAYASHRAFRFAGQRKEITGTQGNGRGACVEALRFLPSASQRDVQLFVPLAPRKFSIDVWFGLHASATVHTGGILLGAQSARWQDAMVWPDYHQQFIHVDPQGDLYCSVVGDKRAVTTQLQCRRWYHLALVFDGDSESVYLDGVLIRRTAGPLHRDWRSLYFMQVGTGYISAGSAGAPSPKFSGWYAFHGLVDELRIWEDALTPRQVELLASDTAIEVTPTGLLTACDASSTYLGDVVRVQSSRPRERACIERTK